MPANRKAQIERINQVSAMARTSWIALLGYLAFIGVTLLGVEDADFFVPSRQTQLPLINVSIPTASFFIFAPILAAALYIYLHIILIKLWDAIADANTPRIEGHPLADHLNPWLVNDWALTRKGPPYTPARPLLALGNAASFLLVWAAGPLVLFFFWLWSMPAHEPIFSLFLAGCFLLALTAGITSWQTAHVWLVGERGQPRDRPYLWSIGSFFAAFCARRTARLRLAELVDGSNDRSWRHADVWYLAILLTCVTLLGTAFPLQLGPISTLAPADFRSAEMVATPDGWRAPEAARQAYRETWCGREGLAMSICGPLANRDSPLPPQVAFERGKWCEEHEIASGQACTEAFAAMDARFASHWQEERGSTVADLTRLDLSGRDLRHLDGMNVALVGANLSSARLEWADLDQARLEGADLVGARLMGADLRYARLEGAKLGWARLDGANLGWARLQGADLGSAVLEGANLGAARLEGADLGRAWLKGADLGGARLIGTDLRSSDLRWSNWAGTSNRASTAHFADFRGAKQLTQAQLDNMIGNAGTLLTFTPESAQALYVWSCWDTPPEGFDALVARLGQRELRTADAIRDEFLCGPDNPRRKTGTPLALDADRPPDHPLGPR